MEHYDGNHNNVREKNVYLLHLDTPRIILIASVIIGVVAASFLFGMNFTGKNSKGSFKGDLQFSENKLSFPDENLIPPAPGSGETIEEPLEVPVTQPLASSLQGDILTADNIKEIIQPAAQPIQSQTKELDDLKKQAQPQKKAPAVSTTRAKKAETPKTSAPFRQTNNIVEASAPKDKNIKVNRSGSFSIQVAAFDTSKKAEQEAGDLRSRRYDSYIDRTVVNGQTYFRVRIGPIPSRENAMSLLHDVQGNPKYQNAYIIRE